MTIRFTAKVVRGSSRGKTIGFPTINVSLDDVPGDLRSGIYACRITLRGTVYPGALHYGPRPVFNDSPSCEVHIIDSVVDRVPETVDIEIIEYIRDVQNFPDAASLAAQLRRDIDQIRGMLRDS